jgi:hypothetical protein
MFGSKTRRHLAQAHRKLDEYADVEVALRADNFGLRLDLGSALQRVEELESAITDYERRASKLLAQAWADRRIEPPEVTP